MQSYERQEFLINRPRYPANDAAVFVENRLLVPGQQGSIYVNGLDRFAPVQEAKRQEQITAELWQQANEEKDKLFQLVERVRAKLDKKSANGSQLAKIDLRNCTWDQFMEEVQNTATLWSTTSKKNSTMRLYLDKLGRNSDAFQSWLQVLPGGDYGSSICGVFTIAIGAAGHYTKVEDAVIKGLAEIPEIIDGARRYIQIYSQLQDHFLEKRTFELYMSILKALTNVMRFFAESSPLKVVIKQSSYQAELLRSLQEVKSQAERIKEEANQCMQQRLMEMDRSLLTHGNILLDTNESSAQSLEILQTIYRLLFNTTGLRIADPEESREPELSERKAIQASMASTRDSQASKASEVLQLLQYNPDTVSHDIQTCLRLGDALDESSKAKAATLITNQTFKAYMTGDSLSSALLVNGNDDLSSAEGLSPLSLVAARLAFISESTKSSFVLKYFCGEHNPYIDHGVSSSPTGLIASFVGQLISQVVEREVEIDWSFLTADLWIGIRKLKIKKLCTVLHELAKQLPPKSVLFLIIDEPGTYELGQFRNDTDTIIRALLRLLRKNQHVTSKLLVTCRGRAVNIREHFIGNVLDLEETIEAEDSSGWKIANSM